jgi:SAM-dependent methyltransferase
MTSFSDKNHLIEDLDYSKTPKQSIWGAGDKDTLTLLKKLVLENKLTGVWLNFAAGDGRYNNILLKEANSVIATYLDKSALKKLQRETPQELSSRLTTETQDLTKPFPFKNGYFDGVFNTGTLHLFPKPVLESVFKETYRILKPGGIFIFDFATDIKRVKKDGSFVGRSNIIYSKSSSKTLLSELLEKQGYKEEFFECKVPPEEVTSGSGTYMFSCNYWLVVAKK